MQRTVALVVLSCLLGSVSATYCLDENGKAVDWWFIYKMPNGFSYAYKDSNDHTTTLTPFTDRTLDRLDGALGSTLHQIYANKKNLGYVLYNDELPDSKSFFEKALDFISPKSILKESSCGAHAKGVVATDGTSGFWLVHSVPKFPDLRPATFTWTADDTYAQSFLCMSLSASEINTVGTQLQYFHPKIFDSNMPPAIARNVPSLAQVLVGARIAGTNVAELTSVGGTSFVSFAKDADWNSDLYPDLVVPTLHVGFEWETWRRGGDVPSDCGGRGKYPSVNILSMRIGSFEFGYTHDHAKIGIATAATATKGSNYVCVGDINQMVSQRKRGGGTVCFVSHTLWTALSSCVVQTEQC